MHSSGKKYYVCDQCKMFGMILNISDIQYFEDLLCFSSTLVLDKKLIHVVYSKLDRDVLVIAMPAERYVHTRWSKLYVQV